MSQENVEIVRRAWEAFMRRDNEAALAFYDQEVELHHQFDGSVYRGLTGVRAFFRDWLAAWSELLSNDVEEWIDGGDEVIAVMHVRARGRRSGVPVERRECHVWTLRGGKLWRLRIYRTKAEALEAVGLSEQVMSQENVELGAPGTRAPLPDPPPLTQAGAEIRKWVAEAWDEDGDYYPVRKFPESRPCHGRDEIADFLIDYGKVWARYEQRTIELIPIGGDRVLIQARLSAEGRESGLSLDGDIYFVLWLRHGRYFRQEDHLTLGGALHALGFRADTLEAAGLRE